MLTISKQDKEVWSHHLIMIFSSHQVVDVGLEDPTVKNENLGFLRIYIKISLLAEEEAIVEQSRLEKKHKISNLKVWNSILTITLLEAKDLPAMDQNGRIYGEFRYEGTCECGSAILGMSRRGHVVCNCAVIGVCLCVHALRFLFVSNKQLDLYPLL